jgi:hypothetical protein
LFRLKERNDAACLVASAAEFISADLVQLCFQMNGFAQAIFDMLEVESDEALLLLMNGPLRGLSQVKSSTPNIRRGDPKS